MYGLSCGALPFLDMLGEYALHNGDSLLRLNSMVASELLLAGLKRLKRPSLKGGDEIRGVWLPFTRNTKLRESNNY